MKITPELKEFQRRPQAYEEVVGDIIRLAPRGGVMIDCGAHVGDHSQPMAARADVRRVYAVEAIPRLCESLRRRFAASDSLRVVQTALGRTDGHATFHVAADQPGYSGLIRRDVSAVSQWEPLEVEVRTLDGLIEAGDASAVGLVKLDLEGGEFDALRGGVGVIARSRPLIVFENGLRGTSTVYGYDWAEFSRFFDDLDYQVADFFGNAVDRSYWDSVLQTYMFVATARRSADAAWVGDRLPEIVSRRAGLRSAT